MEGNFVTCITFNYVTYRKIINQRTFELLPLEEVV